MIDRSTDPRRQEELKNIILKLHEGVEFEVVKEEFEKKFGSVSATEIANIERALVEDGMPVENIQLLCDVHAAVFRGSIEEIHSYIDEGEDDGDLDRESGYPLNHPVSVLKRENRAIEELIDEEILPLSATYAEEGGSDLREELKEAVDELAKIDSHYARKENLIFPIMERNGITAPPQVMWGVDDEIRAKLKNISELLSKDGEDPEEIHELIEAAIEQLEDMIFKEEEILLPMVADVFTAEDWEKVSAGSADFGFMFTRPMKPWKALKINEAPDEDLTAEDASTDGADDSDGAILFDAGSLTPTEINSILNTVPFDMTFVDADDRVKYFTQGAERIFARSKTVIGREVSMCHPPKSVHLVEKIVDDFKTGKKDSEEFWIQSGDMFIHIRYFAIRDKAGIYLGTLEVSQNIKPLRDLEGEKRLMS